MEQVQSPILEESNQENPNGSEQIGDPGLTADHTATGTTPVPAAQIGGGDVSFASLEAYLQVAPTSRTQLTELLLAQSTDEQGTSSRTWEFLKGLNLALKGETSLVSAFVRLTQLCLVPPQANPKLSYTSCQGRVGLY